MNVLFPQLVGMPIFGLPLGWIVLAVLVYPTLWALDEGAWIDRKRERLCLQRVRALEILADCLIARGDHARAIAAATEIIELDESASSSSCAPTRRVRVGRKR